MNTKELETIPVPLELCNSFWSSQMALKDAQLVIQQGQIKQLELPAIEDKFNKVIEKIQGELRGKLLLKDGVLVYSPANPIPLPPNEDNALLDN